MAVSRVIRSDVRDQRLNSLLSQPHERQYLINMTGDVNSSDIGQTFSELPPMLVAIVNSVCNHVMSNKGPFCDMV